MKPYYIYITIILLAFSGMLSALPRDVASELSSSVAPDSVRTELNDSVDIDTLKIHEEVIDTLKIQEEEIDTLKKEDGFYIEEKSDTMIFEAPRRKRFVKEMVDLDNVVNFTAKDSLVFFGQSNAEMYGKSSIKYGDIKFDSHQINMNLKTNIMDAKGYMDTTGVLQDNPVFKDPSGEYESKTMSYNFKTKKGYIRDVITEQGEGFLTGGITKKLANNEYYIKDGHYTTCDEHDHPHFYFNITKGKVKPKKNIVTGPAYLVLFDVPTPLAVPFGFFPFSSKYSSGVIFPTFGEDYTKGFYLRNGGYYFAINDNIDLALTGEIYSKGSWGVGARSAYVKRYKYSGNFDLSYITTINGEKGQPDYSKMHNFRIAWYHNQDSKANPNMNFSANVNFTTSGYTRNDLNSYYNNAFTENTKSSSVNMTYRVPNSKWSFSTTANISQRTADSTLAVSFPNITVTMSQIAPFKRKRVVGSEKWYEKIKMSYSGIFQNDLTAKQNQFFKKSLVKDWRNGMRHSIPISATFNILKYLNVTPAVSMTDRMYTSKIRRGWDPTTQREAAIDTVYGFYNIFDFSASMSFNTKIYGFFRPWKIFGDKVKMIRHVLTPTVSFSATPDFSTPFWGYYGTYQYSRGGINTTKKYSYFSHGKFGTVGTGRNQMVNWSLANNVEMKVKSNSDSTGEKKISLIENLTLSQSYNFVVDSMNWSDINMGIMLRLIKNFNLSLNSTWDVYTYQLNSAGNPVRVNIPRWKAGKGIGRLRSTGTSFSYTFNNDTFRRGKKNNSSSASKDAVIDPEQYKRDEAKRKEEEEKNKIDGDGYEKWECPWSLSINYSVSYGYGAFNKKKMEYDGRFTQNLSFSGNIRPTQNWSMSFSASYDFNTHKIAYMNCSVSRNLHCFGMSASFIPVGPYKSYNFNIAVNSSILQDLKYDKQSSLRNGVDWY